MYQLKYSLIGKSGGNFRPKENHPEKGFFLDSVKRQMISRGIRRIFSPHCAFTTNIARFGDINQITVNQWLTRTTPGFDGGIVTEPNTAIAIFSADCPVIILFDKQKGHLVVLHAGLRSLIPENREKPNIIESAFKDPELDPSTLDAFVGFGAGHCCYGVKNYMDELGQPEYRDFLGRSDRGICKGQPSLDLISLGRRRLIDCKVGGCSIALNRKCTACAGRDNDVTGLYHSNIYEGTTPQERETRGCNLVLAWFQE